MFGGKNPCLAEKIDVWWKTSMFLDMFRREKLRYEREVKQKAFNNNHFAENKKRVCNSSRRQRLEKSAALMQSKRDSFWKIIKNLKSFEMIELGEIRVK